MGYVGTGVGSVNNIDFWEYSPGMTAINELKTSSLLNVFPNPAGNAVTITFKAPTLKGESPLTISIKNELGVTVYSENKKGFSGDYVNTIDLSKQPKGTYFIEMILGNQKQSKKIVLQ
jgi:hypothetical protein